jgi:hypothetical protein
MNRRLFPVLAGLAWLLPIAVLAQGAKPQQHPNEAYRIRVQYGWFSSQLEGTASKSFLGVAGSEFDVTQDLGVEDDRTWFAYGTIRLGAKWKLRGGYIALNYGGTKELTQRIIFGETIFQTGETVSSSIKGGYISGDLEWDFVRTGVAYLGLTGGARAPDVDTVLVSPDTGKREQGTYRPVSPELGVAGRVYIGRMSLEGFASTFFRVSGRKITDLEITARLHFSPRFCISGGYKYISFNTEKDFDTVDLKVKGWTYGLELGL